MTSSMSKFNHLRIPLNEISSATNNFAEENLIGGGAFGKVYKGRFWWCEQWIDISARRLDRRYGLGDVEFWAEISMLSSLEHRNIVSIIGFCDEKDEKDGKEVKIIVNKHETKGSLQGYISGSTLTWMQRLRICVGVAHAVRYLHDRCVIHHNINSSTILLDKNREPKLSGFEFSMRNPSTREDRVLLTQVGGTIGYVDPEYEKTGGVTYKSDVFALGVVLFETLCGRKAFIEDDHDHRFLAPLARLHYDKNKVHEMVDPDLWKNMDPQSFLVFSEAANSCLKEQPANRPSMDEIFSKLEKAYNLQLKHENPEQSRVAVQLTPSNYWEEKHLEHLKIPLKDIALATEDFSKTYCIASGGFAMTYKAKLDYFDRNSFSPIEWKNAGELPKRSGNVSIKRIFKTTFNYEEHHEGFLAEIEMHHSCKHRSIVSLLGFCDEGNEMIIVYEYASKGSLADYLEGTNCTSNLPWGLRLKICLDIAHGLNYLHTNTEDKQRIIHRDIKNTNILFGNNWEAKISDFGLSIILPSNQQNKGTESDIYSFGVLLFELLCGRLAYDQIFLAENRKGLAIIARQYFDKGTLKEIVDPKIKEEIDLNMFSLNKGPNQQSLDTFSKVAYQCLAETQVERPTMEVIIKELEKALHFHENRIISLEDIKSATKNFSHDNYIGGGGSAMVYKGELQEANKCITIVAKQLKRSHDHGQWKHQYLTERQILLEYKHESIIGLVGYCDQMDENIIVYEHMSNGSLDKHLKNVSLTWRKRLEICIDVASGLDFLHGGGVTQEVVIHRDIKSANILLNGDWKAKIADFGLSLISSIDKKMDFAVKHVCGTLAYCDPLYKESSLLTRESDIYSFGVVLFEILSGRLAYEKYNEEFLTMLVKRSFQEGKLDEVVFEVIKEQIAPMSLTTFQMIAYQCLHDEREKRPTTSEVLVQLKKALKSQENSENFKISLEDIKSATQHFSAKNYIGGGRFGMVYKGEVSHINGQNIIAVKRMHECFDRELDFLMELEILFEYKHENIIDLAGYCDEMGEKIIVYEYASRGSLDKYLKDDCLTWMKRLEICIDVASGLGFLHGGGVKQEVVIHRDFKSANILLVDDWKAKITGFGLSLVSSLNKEMNLVVNDVCSTLGYCDPLYKESGLSTRESDIYSLGVVLFEILSGKFAYENDNAEHLTKLVKHGFQEGKLDEIVFEGIKEQIAPISLSKFQMIAYQCLHDEREKRPTTSEVLVQLKKALKSQENSDNFKISLEDIKSATQHFSTKNHIGGGRFGMVYKGEVSHINGHNVIAVKRLHESFDGEHDFLMELEILFEYKHENIIGLAGYCDEMGEKIIVYEYASRGSLDKYLKDDCLTWMKRLEICIDVASGLSFLHGGGVKQDVVIHRDIKSANILLVDDWKPKITGFGLSFVSSINKEMNLVVNHVCSTRGYCEPLYKESGLSTRESDIYSLGVVLFEVLCGKLAYEKDNDEPLTTLVKRSLEEGKLDEIVFKGIKEQIVPQSLDTFQMIAYGCLHDEREKRPTAPEVVRQLKNALKFQVTPRLLGKHLEHLKIPLEDILLATEKFSSKYCIGSNTIFTVYKAELNCFDSNSFSAIEWKNNGEQPKRSGNVVIKRMFNGKDDEEEEMFFAEVENLSRCKHPNIGTLLGFCTEGTEMIIVYEYASKGSLNDYLTSTDHMSNLPWGKRLKICLDIAHGLHYLHDIREEIIHRDIKSSNILLGDNWEAKITNFGFSKILPPNQEDDTLHLDVIEGTKVYMDPEYMRTGELSKASDIYSFGVVLFEIMCGRVAYDRIYRVGNDNGIASIARRRFYEGTLKEMVDPRIKEEFDLNMFNRIKGPDQDSLDTFSKVAYQCLTETQVERPTILYVIKELEKALHFHENHERLL